MLRWRCCLVRISTAVRKIDVQVSGYTRALRLKRVVLLAAMFDMEQDLVESKPLTREEAQKLREVVPCLSPWAVIGGQLAVGVLVALLSFGWTQKLNVAQSVFYGALAVLVPAALFVRGMNSKLSNTNHIAAVTRFFVWELVKIALTLAMLFAAPRAIENLSWPALLLGLVVTMKAVWLVLWLQSKLKT